MMLTNALRMVSAARDDMSAYVHSSRAISEVGGAIGDEWTCLTAYQIDHQ
jgi:hypothetical protein